MNKTRSLGVHPIDILPSPDFIKGYIAGFFDGEGSVGLYFHKDRPKPVISITNFHWHTLNYLQALGFPLLRINFRSQKRMQLRISAWEDIKSFVEVFKGICQVKREELELMDKAVKLHENLVKERKGRKVYYKTDIQSFNQIAEQIKEAKKRTIRHGVYMEEYRRKRRVLNEKRQTNL